MPRRKYKKTQPKWRLKTNQPKYHQVVSLTPEEYMAAEGTICPRCLVPKQDVQLRLNQYALATTAQTEEEATETLCGQCAHELWLDS